MIADQAKNFEYKWGFSEYKNEWAIKLTQGHALQYIEAVVCKRSRVWQLSADRRGGVNSC